ncbi:MAG: amidohydrolase [Bacteroidales bacterium]|nr:amidohydrolase [Bacteroidales bacterium]
MQDLKVAIIQTNLAWENHEANRSILGKKIDPIVKSSDVILLPEMFATAFTMNAESCAEDESGESVRWMQQKAKEKECVIGGSLLIRDSGKCYNRFYWVRPDGTFEMYNKRHLFRMGHEDFTMTPGSATKIVSLKGWKINLQICYDLRFPVWSKNKFIDDQYDYDVLIYVSNWPTVRKYAYKNLLVARAIENQAYVIWVNRVGKDGNRVDHSGDSMIIDPSGIILHKAPPDQEIILNGVLSSKTLFSVRQKFKVGLDWDNFQIKS